MQNLNWIIPVAVVVILVIVLLIGALSKRGRSSKLRSQFDLNMIV